MDGLLLIDKPSGWTSFDVVAKIRGILRSQAALTSKIKVGHTGTLDPLATGLLVLLIGSYTKRASEFSKLDKTYEVTMKLGETSTTGDEEGTKTQVTDILDLPKAPPSPDQLTSADSVLPSFDVAKATSPSVKPLSTRADLPWERAILGKASKQPTESDIKNAIAFFIHTEYMQVPHAFSAIKVGGQRAYKLARAGKEVKLEPRKVKVYSIQLTAYSYPEVKFTTEVSSGTYIRSLVEDIGKALGTGAYMSDLRRTQVGDFKVKDSQLVTGVENTIILTTMP